MTQGKSKFLLMVIAAATQKTMSLTETNQCSFKDL